MSETNLPRLTRAVDRRTSSRFPIDQEVRYKVFSEHSGKLLGGGRTVNMSSAGVLFTTESQLTPGKRVELAVAWPAQLNQSCRLKFVATGRIVRCDDNRAAIAIEKYEFRTLGVNGLAGIILS